MMETTKKKLPVVLKISTPPKETLNIHLLPLKIDYSGFARVDSFFNSKLKSHEDGTYSNDFRGVPLFGSDWKVPEGYKGFIFREDDTETFGLNSLFDAEKEETPTSRQWTVQHTFEAFTFWSRSKISGESKQNRWLQWLELSSHISQKVVDIDKPLKYKPKSQRNLVESKNIAASELSDSTDVQCDNNTSVDDIDSLYPAKKLKTTENEF